MNGRPSNEKMFPVRLLRHYVPIGDYEIIGHDRDAVIVKDAAGKMVEMSPAEFIKGEMTPAPYPGTGFEKTFGENGKPIFGTKIWRNTHIRLPIEEAKNIMAKGIAVRADALPA